MSVVECANGSIPGLFRLPAAINTAFEQEQLSKDVYTISTGARVQETVVIPENSSVNIENSSDVIIGPVTQFHGPVTIYQGPSQQQQIKSQDEPPRTGLSLQNGHATCDATDAANPKPPNICSKEALCSARGVTVLTISVLLLSGLPTVAYLLVSTLQISQDTPDFNLDDPDSGYKPLPGPGNHLLVYRAAWGGRPPGKDTRPLHHPVPYVIIMHTATPKQCKTQAQCNRILVSIQEYHVGNMKEPDVGYNFLVGGEANVYVARGWDAINYSRNDSVSISFIGNYIYDSLTDQMIQAAQNLIAEGVRLKKVSETYTLVCHNQTKATQSPGPNVYRVVKTWPHFSPEPVI